MEYKRNTTPNSINETQFGCFKEFQTCVFNKFRLLVPHCTHFTSNPTIDMDFDHEYSCLAICGMVHECRAFLCPNSSLPSPANV